MKGFTLIEALVYIGLFSLLMGGAIVGTYNVFEAASRTGTVTMLQEESDFLVGKIEWALSGAQAVTAPAAGMAGNAITVAKWDTSLGNPIVLAQSGSNLTLSRSGGVGAILNNSNIYISSISFLHATGTGMGINPEYVQTVLTLSARTPTGSVVMRTATSTVYLRR